MDQIYELLAITLGAILANNFIFSQFLGCCPFLGVSKKVDTAVVTQIPAENCGRSSTITVFRPRLLSLTSSPTWWERRSR